MIDWSVVTLIVIRYYKKSTNENEWITINRFTAIAAVGNVGEVTDRLSTENNFVTDFFY